MGRSTRAFYGTRPLWTLGNTSTLVRKSTHDLHAPFVGGDVTNASFVVWLWLGQPSLTWQLPGYCPGKLHIDPQHILVTMFYDHHSPLQAPGEATTHTVISVFYFPVALPACGRCIRTLLYVQYLAALVSRPGFAPRAIAKHCLLDVNLKCRWPCVQPLARYDNNIPNSPPLLKLCLAGGATFLPTTTWFRRVPSGYIVATQCPCSHDTQSRWE